MCETKPMLDMGPGKVPPKAPLLFSSRLTLCLMNCVALLFLFLLRINLSLTLVCMVRQPAPQSPMTTNGSVSNDSQSASDLEIAMTTSADVAMTTNVSGKIYEGEFSWTRSFQGHVLSSYFYGYISTMGAGGWLSGRFGGKHVLGTGLFVSSIATILIPAAVRLNRYLIIVLRVIVGAAGGVFLPSCMSLSGLWYAPFERSFLTSVSRVGVTLGSILAFLTSSQFCDIPVDNGWPMAFYVTGGACFVFWICWNFVVYNSPAQHPRVSQLERDFIASTSGIKTTLTQRPPFPWLRALTSPAVFAILVAQSSNAFFASTALTSFPLYVRDVLRFGIKQNGLFFVLSNVCVLMTNVPLARLADFLRSRRILSTVVVRKLFQAASSLGCCTLLLLLTLVDYDRRNVAVGLLIALGPVNALCYSGYGVNPLDIAPRYSGEISGISNTVASTFQIVAPTLIGYLTTNGTKEEWMSVFYIAAGLFLVSAILYMIFAKGEVLPWAREDAKVVASELVAFETNGDVKDSKDNS